MIGARIFHVNVNCRDLERARRFYVDGIGLTVGAHTTTEHAQDGVAFGLDKARWDALILVGANGFAGGAIDLLEWQEPAPVGAAPASVTERGFQRLGLRVPDLDATIAHINQHGGATWSGPLEHGTGGHTVRVVIGTDPDGTVFELIEGDVGPALMFAAIACVDLGASTAFYERLGFSEVGRFSVERDDAAHLHVDGPVAMDEVVLAAPGGGEVSVILVGFRVPGIVHAAARPANTIGMGRLALLVPDLDAAVAALDQFGIATMSRPVAMAMGEGLPDLRFVCFRGPDGEVIELIEQPAPA